MSKLSKYEDLSWGVVGFIVFLAIVIIFFIPWLANWLWEASTLATKTTWHFTYWQMWGVLLFTGIALSSKR